jgi:peptidoglycan hydrolase-like protein with peptidoglycan-binding domain
VGDVLVAKRISDRCFLRTSPVVMSSLGLLFMIFLGLLVTEPAAAATLGGDATEFASCPALGLGSSGSCVKQLQRQLDKDHVSPYLTVDGRFGKKTEKAVKNFQHMKGLHDDGIVGPQTFRALRGTQQPPAVRTTTPSSKARILRSVKYVLLGVWRRVSVSLLTFGGIIVFILGAAAIFGVKSVHITYSRKRVDCDIVRFPPQRIVDTQAEVIRQYMQVQSRFPQQLPPPDNYIRSIGEGS